jgi:hypothetical protein
MVYQLKGEEQAISVDGMAGCNRALIALGAPVAEIKAANKASGEVVAKTARNIVPVKSGALRKTIRIANVTTHVKIRAGMARVPYANPIHWGWFYDKESFVYRNIKPNPFMARALGYTRDEVLKNYTENMQKLIAKYEPPANIKY